MTYPFMDDPVPPGHGERVADVFDAAPPSYGVVVVLQDGNPKVEKRFERLDKALAYREKVRAELKAANHHFFFVGVCDEDDPERGWLEDED